MQGVSIVILNWNGLDFLKTCIPSVVKATERYKGDSEIILVDNGSNDGSLDYAKVFCKQMRVISLGRNLGFCKAMNIGVKVSQHKTIICLNNDTIVDENFIEPLARHFSDKHIFAVGAKMLLWDRKTLNFARAMGNFKFGLFRRKLADTNKTVDSLYACGGGFAVDKNKFLELGGFDEDIIIYWEDVDLSYRAWKRGWKTLYEPRSIIYHKFHGTNIKKYGKTGIQALSGEGYFFFVWKNIHDKTLFWQQIFFLPFLILAAAVTDRFYFIKGLFRAMNRLPLLIEKRKEEKQNKVHICDREILRLSSK